jgi:hypothetical protein
MAAVAEFITGPPGKPLRPLSFVKNRPFTFLADGVTI